MLFLHNNIVLFLYLQTFYDILFFEVIKMTVAENIKRIRKEKNLTQKQLGEKCGMSESTLRQYEIGYRNPKLETIVRIAAALEISVFELMDKEDFIAQKNELKGFLTPEKQKESEEIEEWIELYSQGKTEINSWNRELELLNHFRKLNFTGEHEAIKRVSELTELPRYTTPDPPQS